MSICSGCLNTKREMMTLNEGKLNDGFLKMVEMEPEDIMFPIILCAYCRVLLKNYLKFKDSCINSINYLKKKHQQKFDDSGDDFDLENYLQFFTDREKITKKLDEGNYDSQTPVIETEIINDSDMAVIIEDYTLQGNCQNPLVTETVCENIGNQASEINENEMLDSDTNINLNNGDIIIPFDDSSETEISKEPDIQDPDAIFKLNTHVSTSEVSMQDGYVEIVLGRQEQLKELEEIQKNPLFKNAPFKCHMCSQWYKTRSAYLKHSLKHQLVCGRYICDICTQRFSSVIELGTHQYEHSRRYTCATCGLMLHKRVDMISHVQYEHREI